MLDDALRFFDLTKKGFRNIVIGCMIMAFTMVNIHIPAQITEGGILGLSLFSYKVLGMNPSIVSPILDILCIALGFSLLGKKFLKKTIVATISFALSYRLFLMIGPVMPDLYEYPILAAIIGGIGIGVGCGLVIIQGGAAGGDDALALVISKKMNMNISLAYLFTDVTVLLLSLVYIPFGRIFFSLITTIVSSTLIGQFEIQFKSLPENQTAN